MRQPEGQQTHHGQVQATPDGGSKDLMVGDGHDGMLARQDGLPDPERGEADQAPGWSRGLAGPRGRRGHRF